jgi:hypothetical protein
MHARPRPTLRRVEIPRSAHAPQYQTLWLAVLDAVRSGLTEECITDKNKMGVRHACNRIECYMLTLSCRDATEQADEKGARGEAQALHGAHQLA